MKQFVRLECATSSPSQKGRWEKVGSQEKDRKIVQTSTVQEVTFLKILCEVQ